MNMIEALLQASFRVRPLGQSWFLLVLSMMAAGCRPCSPATQIVTAAGGDRAALVEEVVRQMSLFRGAVWAASECMDKIGSRIEELEASRPQGDPEAPACGQTAFGVRAQIKGLEESSRLCRSILSECEARLFPLLEAVKILTTGECRTPREIADSIVWVLSAYDEGARQSACCGHRYLQGGGVDLGVMGDGGEWTWDRLRRFLRLAVPRPSNQ